MNIHKKKSLFNDYIFVLAVICLFLIGLVAIYSSTQACAARFSLFFLKQFVGIGLGIIIMSVVSLIPNKKIIIWGMFFHYIVICLLLFTLLFGSKAMGAARWINLGFFKFQPSELAKVTLPLWIINYFFTVIIDSPKAKDWLILLSMVFFTTVLIFKQPDLGSSIVVGLSGFLMLFISGLPKRIVFFIVVFFASLFPIFWKFVLKDYQKMRVITFLGGGSKYKERYQIEQSQIAIGSGGIFGKGFLKGTQKNFSFLPESRTDFIFSILAEEFGLIGISILVFLYILIIIRLIFQFSLITDIYVFLFAVGIVLPFIISTMGNIGMVTGILPIVGIPLPCISYGITHIWNTFIMFGIVNSIIRDVI
jgi:rod shape determining protein RodA